MTPIQQIGAAVQEAFPNAVLKFESEPINLESGSRFLDLEVGAKTVIVEWRPKAGFGISLDGEKGTDKEIGYGEGPQQVIENLEDAAQEIIRLLKE